MANKYYDIQFELHKLAREIDSTSDFIADMQSNDFDSFVLTHPALASLKEAPDVAAYLYTQEEEVEADFNKLVIDNALSRLRAAMDVIEFQAALFVKSTTEEFSLIEPVREADFKFFQSLSEQTGLQITAIQNTIDTKTANEIYVTPLTEVRERFAKLNKEGLSDEMQSITRSALLDEIADSRFDYAHLCIEHLFLKASRAAVIADRTFVLTRTFQAGITPTASVEDEIEESLDAANNLLLECKDMISKVDEFSRSVREMGPNSQSSASFKAEAYIPVPLNIISP